ncbi:family 43 glycosylhydrolase [Ruminococcus flavefaciens]|uniref:family 43 glycosylhydrolase n=1 Tax=Ruminococcus flavefaciens TaxID=1265 RepID=UPI0026F2D494|nr:family 43 glycosylhydrolase [Ruminococcus flavefaciens]
MSNTSGSMIPDGLYSIKNVNSGKYLSQRYGNVIQLSSPKAWRLTNQTDGSCVITCGDDHALTVECGTGADGNNISLQRVDSSDAQKFLPKQAGDNTYALLTAVSGGESAVDVYNISKDDGANICQWDYWGGDGQHFVLEAVSEAENDTTDVCLPVELAVSRNTNHFAGNITKQNEHYNYGGDPTAFVDGDTVYAYTGHDVSTNAEVDRAIYNIPEYLCYSTKDLINWNYEGVVMKMSDVSWGDPKSAWAGQVTKHNGRYYLYFCSWDRTSEGKQSIGVAVSDSPKGPFRDIGHPIVRGTLTNDQSSNWDDIDPTVWIENDKNGAEHRYLAWGNIRYYICELNDDMISVKDLNGDGKISFGG